MNIILFSASRSSLLHQCIESLEKNLSLATLGTMHEDRFKEDPKIDELGGKFKKYMITDPSMGLGHAIWSVYKETDDSLVIHMEDDWKLNWPLDPAWVANIMEKELLDQVYISSKKTLEKASREPDYVLGNIGLFVGKKGETFGHLVPNITPCFVRTTMFDEFVDKYEKHGSQMETRTPKRAWKFWLKSGVRRPKVGFLLSREHKLLDHLGSYWRRINQHGQRFSHGKKF